jgi:hypothetical protein
MKNRPYKRKPGDFEVRILADGRVVMVTPDEALVQIARTLEPNNEKLLPIMEDRQICPTQDIQT